MPVPHSKRSLGPLPLLYPEPALLVSVWYEDGKPGVMTAAWSGICNSEPLCLAVGIRPARRTHDALLARKAFTAGIPSEAMLVGTDYAGIVSGRRSDKFAVAGWTAVRAEHVDAPYVAECPVVLECALDRSVDLGSHTLMVGIVKDVKADEDCLDPTGAFPDIRKVAPLIYDAGARAYFGVGEKLGDAFSAGKQLL
ncbi:MAG: flavin reductase family protein [Desulfovibrio sp.]|nr:flavin reductase family protein [Desulfovibrio sp.]